KGTEVKICGILTGIQRRRNKEGKLWASMQLEDLKGATESMVFTTQYERILPMMAEDKAVLVRAQVLPEENAPPKLSIQDIIPIELARIDLPSLISIRIWVGQNGGGQEKADELSRLFYRKQGQTD